MTLYGLIGYPLGHSFSQRYFTEKFTREGISNTRYELFPLPEISRLPALLAAHPELRGLNVTIPYKEAVLPFLDALDDSARAVGAVNTIVIRHGRLTGYNTDVTGFTTSLHQWLNSLGRTPGPAPDYFAPLDGGPWETEPMDALILGTGGAAKAVAAGLRRLGIPYRFVSRHPQDQKTISYRALRALDAGTYTLIVNATPLGTYPAAETCPDIPFEQLNSRHLVYDLVYNPAETVLLQRAEARGCKVKNGLEMLHLQAEAAWAIWQRQT